jgi:hypothetical protein
MGLKPLPPPPFEETPERTPGFPAGFGLCAWLLMPLP